VAIVYALQLHGGRPASLRFALLIQVALTLFSAMLTAAFIVLAVAVLLGSGLALVHLRSEAAARVPWWLAALHALLGLGGFCLLALALRGPPRGLDQGTGSFGMFSAALIAFAALAGGGVFWRRLKQRRAGALLGIHATLAVSGFVVLMAYVFS
jgi:hypothetical protein